MKKKLTLILAAAMVLALMLGSCAAGSKYDVENSYDGGYDKDPGAPSETPDKDWSGDYSEGDYPDVYDSLAGTEKPTDMGEKMIYTADVSVETTDFEASIKTVEDMLDFYGAFLESSNVSGKSYSDSYYGSQTYRRAYYVIRVPVSKFADMKESMGNVGSVLSSSMSSDNITAKFYDTQARRDAYGIEQDRLLAMLEKCETVGEMIEIESRLSEVRYQIEALESTLRNWQNQVDYSTVNLTIREVEEYTKKVETHRTYWQQIGDGLKNTLEGIGSFFKGLFKDLVIALPVLVIVAVVIAAVVVIIVKSGRRRKAQKQREFMDADIEREDKE